MLGGRVERSRCQTCGCVVHGKHHYGSAETCRQMGQLHADFMAFRATAAELDADRHAKIAEIERLRVFQELVEAVMLNRGACFIPDDKAGLYKWDERARAALRGGGE